MNPPACARPEGPSDIPDLNADLGEGEPFERTQALLRWLDSANIAAGGHAGDDDSIRRCLVACRELGVRAGAHPGWPSRETFGRDPLDAVTPAQLEELLAEQVERVARFARAERVALHHVKLHGALYHAVEQSPELASTYLRLMRQRWPGVIVFARAGGRLTQCAAGEGVTVWAEGFLDRGYAADGTLVPRGQPGALLTSAEAVQRWREFREGGGWRSVDGTFLALAPRTLCVHGDSAASLEILQRVRAESGR